MCMCRIRRLAPGSSALFAPDPGERVRASAAADRLFNETHQLRYDTSRMHTHPRGQVYRRDDVNYEEMQVVRRAN